MHEKKPTYDKRYEKTAEDLVWWIPMPVKLILKKKSLLIKSW